MSKLTVRSWVTEGNKTRIVVLVLEYKNCAFILHWGNFISEKEEQRYYSLPCKSLVSPQNLQSCAGEYSGTSPWGLELQITPKSHFVCSIGTHLLVMHSVLALFVSFPPRIFLQIKSEWATDLRDLVMMAENSSLICQ